ncbi:hypothetical protein OJF2_39820 [Aquisphaera giovannonii]|uniref:DUF1501 domain-containing protein n=1 Tax=Aquisphaera giovannonii TaxID=406548 RepID=A0A5B9W628_9BACT|nr:DUF1501 domain-containing protein [Aquisphaera giovannonii]QEH35430.1 hypothetical protein OJF2_39820 [Aquisphaera giovannonii]
MLTRRDLIRRSAFLSMAPAVPAFLARTGLASGADEAKEKDGRVLVVVQLDGGNDGINTVVPFGDEAYGKLRKALRLPEDSLCKVGDGVGLHRALKPAAELMESHRLAIVQGVGYPNPDRSHFESMAIWQTARPDRASAREESAGWLGRALDAAATRGTASGPAAVLVGDESMPRSLWARRAQATSFADASDLTLAMPMPASMPAPAGARPSGDDLSAFVRRTVTTAYATAAEMEAAAERGRGRGDAARYPASGLAKRLELVARSLKAGSPARVFYAIQAGYDTHSAQLPTHARLLGELAGALRAFLDDLAAARLADRVLVLAFSEFGRRPEENGSLGTDHGTAGPVFLAGPAVKPGLLGRTPRLGELRDGDLAWSVDFRSVYAAVLDLWLGIPSAGILGGPFEPLAVI